MRGASLPLRSLLLSLLLLSAPILSAPAMAHDPAAPVTDTDLPLLLLARDPDNAHVWLVSRSLRDPALAQALAERLVDQPGVVAVEAQPDKGHVDVVYRRVETDTARIEAEAEKVPGVTRVLVAEAVTP